MDEIQEQRFLINAITPQVEKDSIIKTKQQEDSRCDLIKKELSEGKLEKQFEIRDGILFKINKNKHPKIYLPDSLIDETFKNYHEAVDAGHFGAKPTIQKFKQIFYFPNMEDIIQQKVAACIKCQEFKHKTRKEGVACEIKTPNHPFERIQIDMIGPFTPSINGNKIALVAVDMSTRFCMAKALKNGSSSEVIEFLKFIIQTFGYPKEIQNDQGKNFISKKMKKFAEENQIKLINSSPYHPQSNGLVERLNGVLKQRIAIYTSEDNKWDEFLQTSSLPTTHQSSFNLGKSPHQLLFNFEPRTKLNNAWKIDLNYSEEDIEKARADAKEKFDESSKRYAEKGTQS